MKTSTMVAIPFAAWFLWDTADYWLPENTWIPVVSYFRRAWKENPAVQAKHVKMFRDFVLFLAVAYQFVTDVDEPNAVRSATAEERSDIEKAMETMMQSDMESHAKCMDTLMVKHKIMM